MKIMLRLYGRYRVGGLIGSLMKIPYNGRKSEHLKFMKKSQTILKKIGNEKTAGLSSERRERIETRNDN